MSHSGVGSDVHPFHVQAEVEPRAEYLVQFFVLSQQDDHLASNRLPA